MKRIHLIIGLLAITFYSCGQLEDNGQSYAADSEMKMEEYDDEGPEATEAEEEPMEQFKSTPKPNYSKIVSSMAARITEIDSSRKLIRTADLKFRTKDVFESTLKIEDIIRHQKGFVASTRLSSQRNNWSTIRITKDSSVKINHYTVHNVITMRVPVQNLDATLIAMVPYIEYLDHRNVNAEDVTLRLKAEQLKQLRLSRYQKKMGHLTASTKGGLDIKLDAERDLLNRQEQKDNAFIEKLRVLDQIDYATIQIDLYGDQKVSHQVVPFYEKPMEYSPSYGEKIGDGFTAGFNLVKMLLVGLITIWPILLAGAIAFGLIIYYRKKNKARSPKK